VTIPVVSQGDSDIIVLGKVCRQAPSDLIQYCEFYRNFKLIDCTKPAIIRAGRLGQPHFAERAQ
jgi:hypothetical protein